MIHKSQKTSQYQKLGPVLALCQIFPNNRLALSCPHLLPGCLYFFKAIFLVFDLQTNIN